MSNQENAVVAVYGTHACAEAAIKDLRTSGFDLNQVSIVGKDHHAEELMVGYYNAGDRMKYWGKKSAFWAGVWGWLFASAFLANWRAPWRWARWVAICAGLYGIGIPRDSVLQYETAIESDQFVLVAYGTALEVTKAQGILRSTRPETLDLHAQKALQPAVAQ